MKETSWDNTWEKIYRSREWGKYPPEELVRFVARNYYGAKDRKGVAMLDLGCGTGAAAWYVAREGFSVCGIDGSATAIKIAKKRFAQEKLRGEFVVGDIAALPYKDAQFDAVVDIAAVQHNSPANIKKILAEVHRTLKPGGKFFSMMIADDKSLAAWPGAIHFFTRAEISRLLKGFKSTTVDSVVRTKNNSTGKIKFWIVEAKK